MRTLTGLALAALVALPAPLAAQVRVKDVVTLDGYRPTPLIGYGLVVGLNKTGDKRQTIFTAQTLAMMLERLGVGVNGGQIKIENTAAVLVTAELPPFARAGARLDVTASSVGDARSLQGGVLLVTAMRGPDGATVALAQGPLSIGGFGGGRSDNSVQINHLTVGRVPGGGLVESGQHSTMKAADEILLSLREADFSTAHRAGGRDQPRAGRLSGQGHRSGDGVGPRAGGVSRLASGPDRADRAAALRRGHAGAGSDQRAYWHGRDRIRRADRACRGRPGQPVGADLHALRRVAAEPDGPGADRRRAAAEGGRRGR